MLEAFVYLYVAVYLSIIFFQLKNLLLFIVFGCIKPYSLYMITFSYKRLIDYILLPFFSGSLFFLLFLSPLIYYSFSFGFYTEYMMHQWFVVSDLSSVHVQNVYMFIQGKASLDPGFSLAERDHMEDVKNLFDLAYLVEIIAGILFLFVLFVFIFQKKYMRVIRLLFLVSLLSLVFFFLLFLALFMNFETTFNLFHTLFFPQGNWSFDSSSILISLFPGSFFEAIAIRIFSVGCIFSFLLFILSLIVLLYSKKRHA